MVIKMKLNKYRNTKIKVDGEVFDSKAEYRRYCELLLLQKAKKISELKRQPKFELQASFRTKNGKLIRAITYKADFEYIDADGNQIIEDVKSFITKQDKAYKLKVKMLLKQNPNINFKEVVY